MTAHEAFWWLDQHPIFKDPHGTSFFQSNLWWGYFKVDPVTRQVEDDKARNTHVEVWMEHGAYDIEGHNQGSVGQTFHDIRLDTGGDTFEEALINLASNVRHIFGDYDENGRIGEYPDQYSSHPELEIFPNDVLLALGMDPKEVELCMFDLVNGHPPKWTTEESEAIAEYRKQSSE